MRTQCSHYWQTLCSDLLTQEEADPRLHGGTVDNGGSATDSTTVAGAENGHKGVLGAAAVMCLGEWCEGGKESATLISLQHADFSQTDHRQTSAQKADRQR